MPRFSFETKFISCYSKFPIPATRALSICCIFISFFSLSTMKSVQEHSLYLLATNPELKVFQQEVFSTLLTKEWRCYIYESLTRMKVVSFHFCGVDAALIKWSLFYHNICMAILSYIASRAFRFICCLTYKSVVRIPR